MRVENERPKTRFRQSKGPFGVLSEPVVPPKVIVGKMLKGAVQGLYVVDSQRVPGNRFYTHGIHGAHNL